MPALPIVVAALAVLAVVCAAVQLHRLRRALIAERAARRLLAHIHADEMQACAARLNAELGVQALLTEADRILDAALVAANHDPEGGPS